MPYSWLLFDADGTLYDFERAEAAALRALFDDVDLPFDERGTTTYHAINRELWAQFERGELSAEVLRVQRFARLFEALGTGADPAAAAARYIEHLSKGAYLLPEAEALVRQLSQSHRLAIITNGLSAVQRPRFAASGIGHLFDPVIISDELGVAKPHPEIFDAALEQMGAPALDEVLLIGDSLSSDMRGGVDYGLDTCWYNPGRRPAPDDLAMTYQIDDLTQLPRLLG